MIELKDYTEYQRRVVENYAFKVHTKGSLIPPFMCTRERKMAKNYSLDLRNAGLLPDMFSRIMEDKV